MERTLLVPWTFSNQSLDLTRLPRRMFQPSPGINGFASWEVLNIACDHLCTHRAGDGPDERIFKWNRMVPGLRHQPSPFHRRRFVEEPDCSFVVLHDEPKLALQRPAGLANRLQFNAAPQFRDCQRADSDLIPVRIQPVQHWLLAADPVAYDIGIGQIS